MMQQTFVDLANSLRARSVALSSLAVELVPGVINDEQYHRFRVEHTLTTRALNGEPEYWPTYVQLRESFEKVYAPGAVEWLP